MKIAILVHAFKNPHQVKRLLERITHDQVDLYLHLDRKVAIEPYLFSISNLFHIKSRVNVFWGDVSQVHATLNSLIEIINSGQSYSHVIFISGQDYPILPIGRIIEMLQASSQKGFIRCRKIGIDSWQVQYRYQKFRFGIKFLDRLLRLNPYRRTHPFKKVYGGSQWWNLSIECIEYILDYCGSHPDYLSFHRFVHCSDEMFFQSILMNSHFADHIVNDCRRYIDWSSSEAHPSILTSVDYESLIESDSWFARKLDEDIDRKIFDKLDHYIETYRH